MSLSFLPRVVSVLSRFSSRPPLSIQIVADRDAIQRSRFHWPIVSTAMSTEYQLTPGDATVVLTFRRRPGPSTCQGLRLMSLIFRTQSARVALMSRERGRERVRCPRRLRYPIPGAADVSVYQGTRAKREDWPGDRLGSEPTNRTNNPKGLRNGTKRTSSLDVVLRKVAP